MKGYKGFNKGLICKNKQYAENTTFEEEEVRICEKGMHFCENPLDVLEYYPLIDNNGEFNEFAEVEALDEPTTDNGKKYASKKLHIGARLSLKKFIDAGIVFLLKTAKEKPVSGNYSKLAVSGNYSKLAASGHYSQLAASGQNSIVAGIGFKNKAKAALGSWIVLAEYDKYFKPVCVKSTQIDGEFLKADTWYELKDGEFKEEVKGEQHDKQHKSPRALHARKH